MTCTTTTEKTSGEHAALTSSPEKETVRREKDKEKEVKRRNRSKTKKSTEESLTDSPSSGSSGEIAAIASAGEALASNLSREALAATTVGTKRARSGSARLLSKIKIKHTSSTFGTSHEGHRTKYDLDDKMEILEHDEDGLSDQEQPKKGYVPGVTCTHARHTPLMCICSIRSRLVKGHSAVVLESGNSILFILVLFIFCNELFFFSRLERTQTASHGKARIACHKVLPTRRTHRVHRSWR
jgi:hypothetical protein